MFIFRKKNFGTFRVLCFLVTPVLRLALLLPTWSLYLHPENKRPVSWKHHQDWWLSLTYHFVKGCLESSNTWVYFLNHVISWANSSQNLSGCSMLFWNVCWYRQREHDKITVFDFLLWTSLIIFLKFCKNFFWNILLKWSILDITMHKKWSFPLRISSVNVTKSAVSCRFGHIYCRNP